MKKGILVVIGLLIVLIVIGGIFFLYKDTYYSSKAVSSGDSSLCLKIKNELKSSNCLALVAIEKKDITICSNSPRMYIMSCLGQYADQNNDIQVCAQVTPEVDEFNCYYAFANSKRETSICSSLTGEKMYYCYEAVAIATQDTSICNNIPASSSYKLNCAKDVQSQAPNS